MSHLHLPSSSFTITHNTNADKHYWLVLANRIFSVKNAIIISLFMFVTISILIPFNLTSSHLYLSNPNVSFRVRLLARRLNRFLDCNESSARNNESNQINADPWSTRLLESEADAIKDSIRKAFLTVNKQIEYCPLYPSKVAGSLNVTAILETMHLNGLVQFYDRSIKKILD